MIGIVRKSYVQRNYKFWMDIDDRMKILYSMFNKAWKLEIIACETLKLEI